MRKPLEIQSVPLSARLRSGTREAWRVALGLLYPPTCVTCQAATGEPHALCAACWSSIRFIERPFCERLGLPFAVDL
ncbi:MAG: double zinc ribbon domain-containing protein, partial [Microvirga sp.]